MKITSKRIAPGFYHGTYKGKEFEIVAYNTDVKEEVWWGWGIKNTLGYFSQPQDCFSTKKICMEALVEYINEIEK